MKTSLEVSALVIKNRIRMQNLLAFAVKRGDEK